MIAFALIAVFASILFVRLGIWQLGRHDEVAERNRARDARAALSLLPPDSLAISRSAPGEFEWRRTALVGRWDYDREVVVRNRTLYGRPGIHLLTPLHLGDGTTIFVLRGWLPAPDGMTPDLAAARGAPGLAAAERRVGLVQVSRTGAGSPEIPSGERAGGIPTFAAADVPAMSGDGAETLPWFAQLLPKDGADLRPGEPTPVPLPEPGNGPHLSYAIQWFSFALIALVGTVALFRRERRQTQRPGRGL
jgi:surfeit locus 1 family protein